MGVDYLAQATASFLRDREAVHATAESTQGLYASKGLETICWILSLFLVRPAQVIRFSKRLGYALVPRLIRSTIWQDYATDSKQSTTSYLNGLRGCTALKVFTFHYMHALSDIAFQPWATNDRHLYILELPIIRYFYAGYTSHIFFAVAGYITCARLLQLMDNSDPHSQAKLLASMSSSLFRRVFRLYLPVLLITFTTATWIYLGFYERNRPYILSHQKYFPGEWNEPKPLQYATYREQLAFWLSEMYDLANICTENTVYPLHDQHLWSILSEMRASLHLFGCLLALSQCRKHVRLFCLFIMTGFYFLWDHWEIWIYTLGAAVAQADIILTEAKQEKEQILPALLEGKDLVPRQAINPEKSSNPSLPSTARHLGRRLWLQFTVPSLRVLAFLLAFYFLSYPIDGSRDYAPGYMTLNLIIPKWMSRKDKFYPNIGTIILLFLLVRSDPETSFWRRFLTSRIPQYLGSISFGFYLVHGPIMHLGGYMVPHWIWWSWFGLEGGGETSDAQWIVGVLLGWAATLLLSLWAADVWTREVEGRCVTVVRKVEAVSFRRKQQ